MRKYINKILFVMLMLSTASLAGCSNDDTLVEQARSQIDTPCFTDSKIRSWHPSQEGNCSPLILYRTSFRRWMVIGR